MQRTEEGISLQSRGMQVPKLLRTNDPVSSTNKLKGDRMSERGRDREIDMKEETID